VTVPGKIVAAAYHFSLIGRCDISRSNKLINTKGSEY
jgi:hypothetical protein